MTAYATLADLVVYGIQATALGSLSTTQQQGCLDRATDEMNSRFAGRYPLPLLAWDTSVKAKCCEIAAYHCVTMRGFNPASGADVNYQYRYEKALKWCDDVRNKAIHPTVTTSQSPTPDYAQPKIYTSSMVNTGGATDTNRGW